MPWTRTGRIVYERRPHLFNYGDVLRIVRKVPPRTFAGFSDSTSEGLAIMGTILASEADFLDFLGSRGMEVFQLQDTVKILLDTLSWLFELLSRSTVPVKRQVTLAIVGWLTPTEAATSLEETEETHAS